MLLRRIADWNDDEDKVARVPVLHDKTWYSG